MNAKLRWKQSGGGGVLVVVVVVQIGGGVLEPLTLVTGGCSQDQGSNFPVIELGYHLLYHSHYHCVTRATLGCKVYIISFHFI